MAFKEEIRRNGCMISGFASGILTLYFPLESCSRRVSNEKKSYAKAVQLAYKTRVGREKGVALFSH
jgi:hypothetical protein